MKKRTDELLKLLQVAKEPGDYIEAVQDELTTGKLNEYLAELLTDKALEKSDVIKESGLDRTYAYQIMAGTKKPSRDKLIALAMAMKLELDEMQALLKSNGYPILYPKVKRDSVIIFAIQRKVSVMETNDLLYELELNTLD